MLLLIMVMGIADEPLSRTGGGSSRHRPCGALSGPEGTRFAASRLPGFFHCTGLEAVKHRPGRIVTLRHKTRPHEPRASSAMRPFASRLPSRFKLTCVPLRSQFALNPPQPSAILGPAILGLNAPRRLPLRCALLLRRL